MGRGTGDRLRGLNDEMTQEPFGDIPLFREIQRLLSSSRGPVNLEIARQIGAAVATAGAAEAPPDPAGRRAFADAVHRAEGLLSGYTRLPVEEAARVEALTRTGWVGVTLTGWSWLLEHLAERFTTQLTQLGAEPEAESNPMQATLAQVGPLLSGMQAGTLVGQLGREALGRYDIPIPRSDEGRLLLVTPNLDQAAADYDLERNDLVVWLALHEVAAHLVTTSVPWVESYLRSLLLEVVDALEIDPSDLERRFVELSSGGMESGGLDSSLAGVLPITSTERHRLALGRLGSFLSVFEGYCAHAAGAVAEEMLEGRARIDEGMARRRAAAGEARSVLEAVLGIPAGRSGQAAGATFCAAVVKLEGVTFLNRMWEAPDNLPQAEEIKDPFAWLERQRA